jgi:Ca2+-binding RTX toxin-like protein
MMKTVSLIDGEVLDESAQSALDEGTLTAQRFLRAIASDEDFLTKVTLAFGDSFDAEKLESLRQQWAAGEFEAFPPIEIRSSAEINGANGAFSADTNTIYLSREYIAQNAADVQAIADVVLEEIGHYIDSQLNSIDSSGDEGAIFSALIQGKKLTETQLQSLKREDDTATLHLDGKTIEVEQQAGFNIEFDFTYDKYDDNTKEFFQPDSLEMKALEAAANYWENVLNNLGEEFDNIPASLPPGISEFKLNFNNPSNPSNALKIDIGSEIDDIRIYVGSVSSFSNPGKLAEGGNVGFAWKSTNRQGTTFGKKIDRRITSKTDYEPFAGTLAFSRSKDWWFDPNPNDITDSVPDGKFDFVTVAIHEIGHVLGLNLDGIPAFKAEIDEKGRFKGSNAKAVNNNNRIQLTQDRHVVGNGKGVVGTNDDNVTNGTKSVMVPNFNPGTRLTPQPLDEAMLKDIGYGQKRKLGLNTLIDGFDTLLAFQQKIDDVIYDGQGLENGGGLNGLPLFGDQLGSATAANLAADTSQKMIALADSSPKGAQFILDLYNKIREGFIEEFVDAADATTNEIQNTFLELLGPEGINFLKDSDNSGEIDKNDINITTEGSVIKFNFAVGGLTSFNTELAKNIGLPQLGFQFGDPNSPSSSPPTADVNLDYTLNFGFGIDTDTNKFFFDTSSDEDLIFSLKPSLPKATATLGFLQVEAQDIGSEIKFSVDFDDGEGGDNQLTSEELDNLRFTPKGTADIKLNLESSIPEAAVLPKIGTDLNIHWDFIEGGAKPTVIFDKTTVYLGSFLSNFVKPIVDPIQTITKPIQKATSFLTEPIGILKDLSLGGDKHNLLGLARQFNPGNSTLNNVEKAVEAIQFIGNLSALVNSIDPNSEDVGISLGTVNLDNFDLTSGASISGATLNAPKKSLAELEQDLNKKIEQGEIKNPDTANKFQTFFSNKDSLDNFKLSFPILDDPTSAIGLLTGKNVDFFKFDLPEFDFKTGIKGSFRIPPVPILKVSFGGEIGAKLDLGFGYDSTGIQQWANKGYKTNDIQQIFDGFFIDDNRVSPTEDLPELKIIGTLKAGVGGDVVIAEGELNGGIQATVNIDLEDKEESGKNLGNSDGKIRPSEFLAILKDDPGCLFEIGGQIDAFLGYYARVGWPPFGKEWEGELARTTLADFGIETCPDKQPILANDGPDKFTGGTLELNIGLRADKRLFINTTDDNEIFRLKGLGNTSNETVTVSALGYTQNYAGVNKIIANAGEFDDVIEVEKIAVPVEFYGGNGDDQLSGGEGNDVINGDSGNDRLFGRGGDDTLSGVSGNDVIFAGDGNDSVSGGDNSNNPEDQLSGDHLFGEGGKDTIDGGAGNDFIDGGADNDKLYGDTEDSQAGNDIILGGNGDDELYGRAGNDNLNGGIGADSLYGGAGDDELLGDAGNDFLIGEAGNDKISGGEGNDTVSYENSSGAVVVNIDEGQSYANAGGLTDLEPVFTINAAEAQDGFGTKDSFKFTVTRDTYDEATQTVIQQTLEVSGSLENLIGSQYGDVLIGNSKDNNIQGLGGDDLLIGNAGNDTIDGGADIDTVSYRRDLGAVNVNLAANEATDGFGGTDQIYNIENVVGSAFDDEIIGNAKDNAVIAGEGADTVKGGAGNDKLYGDAGNDLLIGEAGDDLIDGGTEIDTVSYDNSPSGVVVNIDEAQNYQNPGGSFHTTIVSTSLIPTDTEPNFTINPGTAKDGFGTTDTLRNLENIIGSEYDDILIGNSLDNRILGLAGNDLLVGNAGNDYFDGGDGIDTVSYRRDPGLVKVNLEQNQATDGFGGTDQIFNIENIIGSAFNDEIIGDANANIIHAGDGDDVVNARDGNDIIFGEGGKDTIFGEKGDDFLVGGTDADILNGGSGNDTASYFTSATPVSVSLTTGTGWAGDAKGDQLIGIENLEGSEFEDLLIGDGGNNILSGLGGNDLIYGEAGDDWLDGGTESDRLYGGDGSDKLYGQAGEDLLKGEAGNDQLFGGDGNDQLYGQLGNDTLNGEAGNDYLEGGEGDDQLLGADGNDQLYGQSGNDILNGGTGDDLLDGGIGEDQLTGGDGDDQLYGQVGKDTLDGGAGNDLLDGGDGNDLLSGSDGNDRLYGQVGEDTLNGGAGNDLLDGGTGNDLLSGGDGNDQLYGQAGDDSLSGGAGNDALYGGTGADTLLGQAGDDYLDGGLGNDTLDGGVGNDRLYGQQGDDLLTGGTGDDYLDGGVGNDQLNGNEGNDRLYGQQGYDTLDGGAGADFLDGGTGDDWLYGRDGSDRLYGQAGQDYLDGGTGDDRLEGGTGDDQLFGQQGRDYLDGGTGDDFLWGGDDADRLLGQAGNDYLDGGSGDDQLLGGLGNDQLYGQNSNDTLDGSTGNDYLEGGDGNDQLTGGNGNDYLYGQDGSDTLNGGTGNDNLYGGSGDDQLLGGDGKDLLSGQDGNDRLDSGAGDDYLEGGSGMDQLTAGLGNDQLYGGDDNDQLDSGAGNDYLEGGLGDDQLIGGDGDDQLNGQEGSDILDGGNGNDNLQGGDGADVLRGQAGDDYLEGDNGDDLLYGGAGNNSLFGGAGNDLLYGGEGDNILNGGTGQDTLYGGSGRDMFVLETGAGSDTIFNFVAGTDYLGLMNGLAFEQLTIAQSTGTNASDTLISNQASGELLATLVGVEANTLNLWDFAVL